MYDPIQRMSNDELLIKRSFDEYRLNTLKTGVMSSVKDYGIHGIDEALFCLGYRLIGKRKDKLGYYEQQIKLADLEIENRGDISPSELTRKLREYTPNPATFNVFSAERKRLKHQRIAAEVAAGEMSSMYDKSIYAKEKIRTSLESFLSQFGAIGENIKENIVLYASIPLVIAGSYGAFSWASAKKAYKPIAIEYIASSPVGKPSLAIKRDVPAEKNWAIFNLTHTPKVTIKVKDSNIDIPEKYSNPQLARLNVRNMAQILNTEVSNNVLDKNKNVFWGNDLEKIASLRDNATNVLERTDASLMFATDGTISYPVQIGTVSAANYTSQEIVKILESYMDKKIVKKENQAYSKKAFWKWFTYILGGAGILGLANGIKNYESTSQRRRYYEY